MPDIDDELGNPPDIDTATLSDDPAQLKRLVGTLLGDNRKVRAEAGRRRTTLREVETDFKTLKTLHEEYRALGGGKDAAAFKADLDKMKTDLETANRSNGQLRSKFREQFVDARVRTELEKRGARNVDDAMKLLDVSKIEFDEEKLEVKDAAALTTTLDEFAKAREYLFDPTKAGNGSGNGNGPIRGTSFGRGASDNGNGGGSGPKDIPKDASPEDAMREILPDLFV